MDKVENVNIGGISFIIEENAYHIIDNYLNRLSEHYKSDSHRKEILEGIEERMAELFIDRGCKTSVITQATANEVIGILGMPEEIDDAPEDKKRPDSRYAPRKRLYRNPADKIVGGVFGGIAAYFHIDTVWLRLGFVALLFLAGFTDFGWWNPSTLLLVYAIFWICVPLARTTGQKCEMRGESLSYDDVERRMENRKGYDTTNHSGDRFWGVVGKCLLIIPGVLLLAIGLTGFLAILAVLFGVTIAGIAIPAALSEAFTFQALSPAWITAGKVLAAIVLVLPFVGMLYGGICLLFKIKTPGWRPGLWMLIIWILSLIGLIVLGVGVTKDYWHLSSKTADEKMVTEGESLYIEFEDTDRWKDKQMLIKGDNDEYTLIYADIENTDSVTVVVYPFVEKEHVDSGKCRIKVSSNFFDSTMSLEELKEKGEMSFYRLHGDTLTLSPAIYGKGHPVQEIGRKITVKIPDDMNLIIEKPIFHQFENDFEYSNMDISALRIKELEKTLRRFDIDIDLDDFADLSHKIGKM